MNASLFFLAAAAFAQEDSSQATTVLQPVSQEPIFDLVDPTAPVFTPSADEVLQEERPGYVAPPRTLQTGPRPEGEEPEFSRSLNIRDHLTHVLVDQPGDGRVWARGLDYRASFGEEGFTFLPVFGSQSPQEWPVQFQVSSARVAGEPLFLHTAAPYTNGEVVVIDQDGLREVYHLALDQIEQTFVFDTLPASGELTVDLDVSTELTFSTSDEGLTFSHPEFGRVTYGDAFAVDADGTRIAIQREWTGNGIRLTVPADFVAAAELPLTIDPPVTAWVHGFGAADDSFPDICYDGRSNLYWIVWQEYTSAANADCYVSTINTVGTTSNSFAVEVTSDNWERPSIAFNYGHDTLLVAAEETTTGGSGRISGRRIDGGTNAVAGGEFVISTQGFPKRWPSVGGTNRGPANNAHFCVVWAFDTTNGHHDVQYRVVDWDGTFVTGVETVENSATDSIHTTISETTGDDDLFGDYWTIAWVNDDSGNDQGTCWARRVVWSGSTTSGAGNFQVATATNCRYPSVTSRLDRNIVADGDRPSIVAYERRFNGGAGGMQGSIYARVVTDGQAWEANQVNSIMEDVDFQLDQHSVSVATDGDAFYMTYAEDYWGFPGNDDFDMYMLSGHITETSNGIRLGLAERHQDMAYIGGEQSQGKVATVWDGETASTSDDGMAIWNDMTGANGGRLTGSTLEVPTIDTSINTSVGHQFCDANPNSAPSPNSADSSAWLWIEGSQMTGNNHTVHCVDVPTNQFGYLLASVNPTVIPNPGGSSGILCMTGSGRYTNQIQSSGSSGTYATFVDPTAIIQPTGTVTALSGQSWNFQYWYRDVMGGSPTSNFSNACRVVFNP